MSPSRSQYRQTADVIRTAIERGTYPRGSMLPREEQLADELGVDRSTVNRALRILNAEGLTYSVRSKGTSVTRIAPIQRNAVARYSKAARENAGGRGAFDAEIRALGMTPRSDITVSRETATDTVAELLGTEAVVSRARRMYADDTAVQIATSYIPVDIAEGTQLEQDDSGPGGIVSRFAELGHAQVRITERINVRPPSPAEVSILGMTEDQRVYEITHTGYTTQGRAVEVCIHVMPTHLWTLDYEWPADAS